MDLLHGFLPQRTAFGLTDVAGFSEDIRILLKSPERSEVTSTGQQRLHSRCYVRAGLSAVGVAAGSRSPIAR